MARSKRQPEEFKSGHLEVGMMEVDNPDFSRDHAEGRYGNHRKITAAVNVRESAIVTMKARKLIDDSQAEAALRFRRLWEAMGGKGAAAMDYSREPVDGGGIAQTVTETQIEAGRRLKAAQTHLGVRGYGLVEKVCGEGFQISELYSGKRAQLSAMDALRGFLDDLADLWLLKTRTAKQKQCA